MQGYSSIDFNENGTVAYTIENYPKKRVWIIEF
jgi:hypothetical protein